MRYDLAIVGSGLAGSLLALALMPLPLNIVLLEAKPWQAKWTASADARSLALSYSSVQVLKAIGLWPDIAALATPIEQIHVSSKGGIGISRLQAKEVNFPALGYVIAIDDLQRAIVKALQRHPRLSVMSPALVQDLTQTEQSVSLHLQDSREVEAKVVLAADGNKSSMRDMMGIATQEVDYQQTAIIANIGLQRPHHNIAYERFTAEGPLAALPLTGRQAAMIWTMSPAAAGQRLQLPEAQFLEELQQAFGYRLGRFVSLGRRDTYVLKLSHAKSQLQGRTLLFGNAAHSLHPVAGQGFNLTIRDIALLAEILANHAELGPETLQTYVELRKKPQQHMIKITDGLIRMFAHDVWPITWLRDLGLRQFERMPVLKNSFNRLMSGQSGRLPRLARGLSLKEV